MKRLFFISAMLLLTNVAMSQEFETPIYRSNLSNVEPYEWSVVDDNKNVVLIKGDRHGMSEYSLEFMEWLGVDPGKDEYYVIKSGIAMKVSIVDNGENIWIIVDTGENK